MKANPLLKMLQKREVLVKELNELNTQIIRLTLENGSEAALGAILQAGGAARGSAKTLSAAAARGASGSNAAK